MALHRQWLPGRMCRHARRARRVGAARNAVALGSRAAHRRLSTTRISTDRWVRRCTPAPCQLRTIPIRTARPARRSTPAPTTPRHLRVTPTHTDRPVRSQLRIIPVRTGRPHRTSTLAPTTPRHLRVILANTGRTVLKCTPRRGPRQRRVIPARTGRPVLKWPGPRQRRVIPVRTARKLRSAIPVHTRRKPTQVERALIRRSEDRPLRAIRVDLISANGPNLSIKY